jgi:hypothetical protein
MYSYEGALPLHKNTPMFPKENMPSTKAKDAMPQEIERKFLPVNDGWRGLAAGIPIRRLYLPAGYAPLWSFV